MKFLIAAVIAALCIIPAAAATNGTPKGGGHTPVTICHKPGTPAEHTITVDDDAVQAHLAHGDSLGPCSPPQPPSTPVCPEGYDGAGVSNGVLLCTRTVTNEVIKEVPGPTVYVEVPGPTVYVDKVIEVPGPTVTVPGPTTEVPGPTVYVPGATITVTKVKYKTKIVNRVKIKTKVVYRTIVKVKKVQTIGVCLRPDGKPAVQGKG